MSKELSIIAKNIKKYREKKGISQDKLSKLAVLLYIRLPKLSQELRLIRELKPSKKIADALGVSVDDLLKK